MTKTCNECGKEAVGSAWQHKFRALKRAGEQVYLCPECYAGQRTYTMVADPIPAADRGRHQPWDEPGWTKGT